jgi:hypothetical protein
LDTFSEDGNAPILPKVKKEKVNKRNIIISLACFALIGLTILIVLLINGGGNESVQESIEVDQEFCNTELVWQDQDGIKMADVLYQTDIIKIQAK